ncbi:patatin-like phospholipase family protein [Vagococcus carniphilus]|uniref:patatin-like phospholipase family protein n=1 Tax=Vagococcus carniphilus TaxID=218144 RepID=UPI00289101CF|nr:patatin-like phospholipase family protein [Vagococcus carniphilus]MDT2813358.1 patatin-like phospholipase family protein [Vagococcus carniphilus]
MLKEIYPSHLKMISFEGAKEWMPFFGSNSQALKELSANMVQLKDTDAFFGWYEKNQLLFIVGVTFYKDEVHVNNLLKMSKTVRNKAYYNGLVAIAKRRFFKKIVLKLAKQPLLKAQELHELGFSYQDGNGYELGLSYNTGLVLGGGGAKGAYQIGVWHCLEELSINYTMMSGTSVGALNGGLILQGELEVAEEMWQSIATEKILSLPFDASDEYTIKELINKLQLLTKTAVQSKGVSTGPLLNLIKELMDPEKIFNREKDFFIVTTETPRMEEKVVSLKEMTEETLPQWLLASSSFFPAMAACQIDGIYYVDGGYRNNVPRDVLLNRGATELLVIDVNGPGITKPYRLENGVTELIFNSSWGLGNVLLFDGKRSTWNMRLGYLEAKKLLGDYSGQVYTFPNKNFKKECLILSREFLHFLKKIPRFGSWYKRKTTLKEWEWLQKNQIVPEFVSLILLESLAKKLMIDPTLLYTLDELSQLIVKKFHEKEELVGDDLNQTMMHSLGEWLTKYAQQKSPISEFQQIASYYHYFGDEAESHRDSYDLLLDVSWKVGLEALFLMFLEKRNK